MAAAGGRVGCLAQSEIDRFQHSCEIAIDVAIPESKNTKTRLPESAIPVLIAGLMGIKIVLAAVDFDDEAMLHADEIHDESLTRRLPAEMVAAPAP